MSAPTSISEIDAPAKVNLGLRIVGTRPDGYHDLESLFVPLDLADRIRLEVTQGAPSPVEMEVEAAGGVPGEVPADGRNLAARAAAAFLERSGVSAGIRIRLTKRIPSPAGLGGGSSDAGAVLRGLQARFPGALPEEALAEIALSLGADVPFFLGPDGAGPVPARVSGVGEAVTPMAGVPSLALALIHPGPRLETARVYAEFDAQAPSGSSLTGSGGAPTMPALSKPAGGSARPGPDRWRSDDWLSQLLANDLEPAARRLCPAIAGVRDALEASGARAVGLTGSGPTVFGIFPTVSAASNALEGGRIRDLAADGWCGVAKTMGSRESS